MESLTAFIPINRCPLTCPWTPPVPSIILLKVNRQEHTTFFRHFIDDWMQHVSANLFSNVSWCHKTGRDTPLPPDVRSLNAPLCGSRERIQSKWFIHWSLEKQSKVSALLKVKSIHWILIGFFSFHFDWFPWCQSFDTVDTASCPGLWTCSHSAAHSDLKFIWIGPSM